MFREDAKPFQPHADVVLADEVLGLQNEVFSIASQSLFQRDLDLARGHRTHHLSHCTVLSGHCGSWGMNYVNDQNGTGIHETSDCSTTKPHTHKLPATGALMTDSE